MTRSIRVTAPAKVNLFLGVGATRPDGYHDVVTITHALELSDELRLTEAQVLSLACDPDLGLPAEQNLAYRAAVAMAERFERTPAVAIELRKRIPHGAGLGGGSSDAAAVIAGLAALWGLEQNSHECIEVAATLGADVPLFLLGACALLTGRGDRLVRTLPPSSAPVVVIKPAENVPTAAAYAVFDRAPVVAGSPEPMIEALESGDVSDLARTLHNNMEEASSGLVPAISDALAFARSSSGVLGAAMAGSGSAVFAVCASDEAAVAVAGAAADRGWWSCATRMAGHGVTVRLEETEW